VRAGRNMSIGRRARAGANRLKERFADLGEKPLKNIARPVRAFGLSPAAIGVVRTGGSGAAPAPTPKAGGLSLRWPAIIAAFLVAVLTAAGYAWQGYAPRLLGASVTEDKLATAPRLSIVVLPFENLSGDKEQDYFADGLTDDLTTDLSHLPDSFVIARNTAFTYKGKPVDVKQLGRELGVRYVLEGSVRAGPDRLNRIPRRLSGLLPGSVLCNFARGA
jgi:adenylate cyclase